MFSWKITTRCLIGVVVAVSEAGSGVFFAATLPGPAVHTAIPASAVNPTARLDRRLCMFLSFPSCGPGHDACPQRTTTGPAVGVLHTWANGKEAVSGWLRRAGQGT